MNSLGLNLKAGSYDRCLEAAHKQIQDNDLTHYMNILRRGYVIHYGHSVDVSRYAHMLGLALDLPQQDLEDLVFASLVHDIGKSSIPKIILEKPERLNKIELDCIKGHTTITMRILENAGVDEKIVDIAHSHHEKLNGTGYPQNLSGSQISKLTQIVTVSDIYSALREQRAYKEAKTHEEAISILRSDATGVNQDYVKLLDIEMKKLKI